MEFSKYNKYKRSLLTHPLIITDHIEMGAVYDYVKSSLSLTKPFSKASSADKKLARVEGAYLALKAGHDLVMIQGNDLKETVDRVCSVINNENDPEAENLRKVLTQSLTKVTVKRKHLSNDQVCDYSYRTQEVIDCNLLNSCFNNSIDLNVQQRVNSHSDKSASKLLPMSLGN